VPEAIPSSGEISRNASERTNLFSPADVLAILTENGWLEGEPNEAQLAWCARAATFLGPQAADRAGLMELLSLVFRYDARTILLTTEAHVVLSRNAAREVLRQLALYLLDGAALNSERFSEMVMQFKERMDLRGREVFHPLRLALAGRNGEGDLDRVILLLDEAAAADFAVPVKSARERILEFCSALD
jgi:nondiscriminating glutamyl-tRNA synthetase